MARILQLGAGKLMTHSIRQIQALGHEVFVVDRNQYAPGFLVADGHAPIDLVDTPRMLAYARDITADAIVAVNDAGVLTAAEVSEALGLRGVSPDIALNALDKSKMRRLWTDAGLPQPRFAVVTTLADAQAQAGDIGYPLIVKPAMNWGSRGVSLVQSEADLEWAFNFASENQREGAILMEQFLEGAEMTIDGLMQDGEVGVLAKSNQINGDHAKYRVSEYVLFPVDLDAETSAHVDSIIAEGAKALGMDNCAIHAEAIIAPDGTVYLLEMAARPGGGHLFGMIVEAVSGISPPQNLVKILLGEDAEIQPRYQRGAVYRFFSPPTGTFIRAEGIEEAQRIEGVLDFGFYMEAGTEVTAIANGAARPGYCVTAGDTRAEAIAIAEKAVNAVQFIME
ncbi:MAG: ATP-grasp domain-containing protein [Chloroflexota bacterium]